MRIFIAAPITDWINDSNTHPWKALKLFIKQLLEMLSSNGHDVFSAHNLEEFGKKLRPESICTPFDFLEVRQSNMVIALPSRSGGVHTEIGWASALNKPMLLLINGDESPLARGLNTITHVETLCVSSKFPEDIIERNIVITEIVRRVSLFSPAKKTSQVAFVATAFGFGPTAKAVAIAQEFHQRCPNIKLDFFGAGVDRDFAIHSGEFDQVISLDVDKESAIDNFLQHCDIYDNVFSIMNFQIAQKWTSKKSRLHIVDSLAWLWLSPPFDTEKVTNYFIQRYLVDEHRLAKWKQNLPIIPVGPICRRFSLENCPQLIDCRILLVNFSGCANPLIDEAIYKEYALNLTQWIAIEATDLYDKIIICVQRHIAEDIKLKVKFPCDAEIGHMPPSNFTQWLINADCILTSPGITTTLELLLLGKKPSFLLAQNYSQALLNERNLKLYPDQLSMAFSFMGPEFAVPEGLPEEEGVRLVVRLMKRAFRDKEDWLRTCIRQMLKVNAVSESSSISTEDLGQKQIVDIVCKGMMNS